MSGVADVQSMLNDNNKNIRKFGTALLAVADYSTPAITEFWNADGTPKALPQGYKALGYITTDGIKMQRSITTANTEMLQDLEPVRTDITAKTRTLQVQFGEANAWTKALAAGLPVSQWSQTKDADWEFTDGQIHDFPYLRLLLLMQDGIGNDAFYRVEYAYRAKITAQGDQTKSRTAVEEEDMTFTVFRDPAANASYYTGQKQYKPANAVTPAK